MIKTLEWKDEQLFLLDQTALPDKVVYLSCHDAERVGEAIRRLEVRGAPAIGAAAAFGLLLGAKRILPACETTTDFLSRLAQVKEMLAATRPTAVNLFIALDRMWHIAVSPAASLDQLVAQLEQEAVSIMEEDCWLNEQISAHGATLFTEKTAVLTHCNAGALATCGKGTALGVIREAYAQGNVSEVYADETRPLLQGARLTAWELQQDGIPVTLITDNMAAWVMREKRVQAVIVGADRIAANGDTANKIGTYGLAVLAKAHHIPFYVAAPSTTFDFTLSNGAGIPLEERSADEVKSVRGAMTAPQDVAVYNPAFDVTPEALISAIITEYGVLKAPYHKAIANMKNLLQQQEEMK